MATAEQKLAAQSLVWSTEKVNTLMEAVDDGVDLSKITNPFWDGNPEWRDKNIVFEYTEEEVEELKKCASDVIYFANTYCYAMTDEGVANIKLRDYQEDILKDFQDNRFCVFLAPRQVGKTISTSIFLTWYLLFNTEKNLMILANNGGTTEELIDKVKNILMNLPFFLKPGMIKNNVMSMKIDNGCRLIGKTTTKTSGIGFTIHFLFMDEFAHIHANFIDPFYRAVYPTLSSSKISRIIITSTPNGQNKFFDIYQGAVDGDNEYHPIRVDWWQVPGRDEAWMNTEIANLGSVEDFNQEYGCQFLASDKLLLDGSTLSSMKKKQTEFRWIELDHLNDTQVDYEHLIWHPKFDFDNVSEKDQFVFSIDTANGGGGDHSVINIFKVIPTPIPMIQKKLKYQDEGDFFSLMQVGLFRHNRQNIEELQVIIEALIFKVFNPEQVKVVLEMDFKGNLLYERISQHDEFWEELFIHTKHSQAAVRLKPGTKLNPKNKLEYCMELKRLVKSGRIITYEKQTFAELSAFGINAKGSYSSQSGHDDIAMTLVNLTVFFDSPQYYELVENIYDDLDPKYKDAIEEKLNSGGDDSDFDFGALGDMM